MTFLLIVGFSPDSSPQGQILWFLLPTGRRLVLRVSDLYDGPDAKGLFRPSRRPIFGILILPWSSGSSPRTTGCSGTPADLAWHQQAALPIQDQAAR